ncbi:MAG: hypothetical protein JNN12_01445 [Bacteroidetes Order II. Incertae sedis bacterium]|nr:hypothetical protein [Bacteroidetes Order II. bacterium]
MRSFIFVLILFGPIIGHAQSDTTHVGDIPTGLSALPKDAPTDSTEQEAPIPIIPDLRTALLSKKTSLTAVQAWSPDNTPLWQNPAFRRRAALTMGADIGILALLWQLWYADYPLTGFHWHNDWGNWAHMDKLGHFLTSKSIATIIGTYLVEDLNLPRRKAGWVAALAGGMGNSQLELLDGISEEWGASPWDLMFNFTGGAIGGLKIAEPDKTKGLDFKISYHPSPQYDPKLSKSFLLRYGGNFLKDYEGETQWVIIRPQYWVKHGPVSKLPRWFGLALGYGAENIPKARKENPDEHVPEWYFALDVDVRHLIPLKTKFAKRFADIAFVIKLPTPTVRLTPNPRFYWLYK